MLNILWGVAVLLVVLWVPGLVFQLTGGWLIHMLLVLSVASVLVRLIVGRRTA